MAAPKLIHELERSAARESIVLRPLVPEDAGPVAGLVDYDRDYIEPFDKRFAQAASEAVCRERIEAYSEKNEFGFGIWTPEILVGSVELAPDWFEAGAMIIGYWVGKRHSGLGYGPEAAKQATHYALQDLRKQRVIAYVHNDNIRSIRTIEKAGFEPYEASPMRPLAKGFEVYERTRAYK